MLRHYDQDERQPQCSMHWDTFRPVLLKAFAQEGARDFDKFWLCLVHESSKKKRLEYCLDVKNSLCYVRAIQGLSGGIPIRREIMEYTLVPHNWKECVFHSGCSWNSQSIVGSGLIPEKNDRVRQAAFLTPLNPSGNDPVEKELHGDHTVPQKVHYKTDSKRNQDAEH